MSTATTPAPAADATVTPEVAAVEDIDALRQGIDDLDAEIARLVNDRAGLSRRIQAARIASGGTRFELSRERVVIDGYRTALGRDGHVVAEAVLRVCRGAR